MSPSRSGSVHRHAGRNATPRATTSEPAPNPSPSTSPGMIQLFTNGIASSHCCGGVYPVTIANATADRADSQEQQDGDRQ